MNESNEQSWQEMEQSAEYDERYDTLGKASESNYSSDNKEASWSFRHLASLRNLTLRKALEEHPTFKKLDFGMLDRVSSISPVLSEHEKDIQGKLQDFEIPEVDFEGNEFYVEGRNGRTMFRTCLGTSPVGNQTCGVGNGRIGQILDSMFSVTPLDYAVTGMYDRNLPEEGKDTIVMTTEYIDPELDLVYDIDGNAWEFDGELHCVRSRYNHWREIRQVMMTRNGRVNRTHVLLFAAMRVATILNAIEPLSVKLVEGNKCSVRGYLLSILNGALPFIRMFNILRIYMPKGTTDASFEEVPPFQGGSGMFIIVQGGKYRDRITVSTDGNNLKHLIIKAIIEGSRKLDTSRETQDETGRGFSSYGNNELLISTFLSMIHAPDFVSTGKAKEEELKLRTMLALAFNSKESIVRRSLVEKNNGLKCGLDLLLQEGSVDDIVRVIAGMRDSDLDRTRKDVEQVLDMDEFGVSNDYEVKHLGDAALHVDSGILYELQYPTSSSITLRRRRRVVGKLWSTGNKFLYKKAGKGRLGLLTIFEAVKTIQVMGNEIGVDFKTTEQDVTSIVNACLSNVFGFAAAVFVLEHLLLGEVEVLEGAPSYLKHARVTEDGVRITSYLHPLVTEKLAFYKGKDGAVYFDTKTILGKHKMNVVKKVGRLENVDADDVEYEGTAVSIGRVFLG